MKRLYLTVEGQTEAAFAKVVLGPHLLEFGVYVIKPRFTGPHGREPGRAPRGGMFHRIRPSLDDMKIWLKEDQTSDARFSMMVDLYSLPTDFPGYAEGIQRPSGGPQAIFMEQALADEFGDARFIPYLQVHEFEALVLCDPSRLKLLYERSEKTIDSLQDDCNRFASPEQINHGQHSHPKHRIQQAVPRYRQVTDGPYLTGEIGLQTLRDKCPHFGEWLTRLEQLDGGAV